MFDAIGPPPNGPAPGPVSAAPLSEVASGSTFAELLEAEQLLVPESPEGSAAPQVDEQGSDTALLEALALLMNSAMPSPSIVDESPEALTPLEAAVVSLADSLVSPTPVATEAPPLTPGPSPLRGEGSQQLPVAEGPSPLLPLPPKEGGGRGVRGEAATPTLVATEAPPLTPDPSPRRGDGSQPPPSPLRGRFAGLGMSGEAAPVETPATEALPLTPYSSPLRGEGEMVAPFPPKGGGGRGVSGDPPDEAAASLPPAAFSIEPARLSEAREIHATPSGDAPPLVPQIARGVEILSKSGRVSLRLQLHPDDLGRIDLRIRQDADGLHVSLTPELASTGGLLDQRIDDLRQTLVQSGLDVATVSVGLGQSQGGSAGPFEGQHPNDWPRGLAAGTRSPPAGSGEAATPLAVDAGSHVDYRI